MNTFFEKVMKKLRRLYSKVANRKEALKLVEKLNEANKKTIIFFDIIDWHAPLFQRAQHVARCMAKLGYNYVFCTINVHDHIKIYTQLEEGLFVVNGAYRKLIIEQLKVDTKYLHLYSTDMRTTNEQIDDWMALGYEVLYEYIDDISPAIYGSEIPKRALEKHKRLLEEQHVYLVCTARKLYEEALAIRGDKHLALITNGVDYVHFHNAKGISPIQHIVDLGKPIIGYFGAFASWFDYKLVKHLASARPEYEIVLIGWDYDGSVQKSGLENYKNVTVLGPIDYKILPSYGKSLDVTMIPFILNEVTEATSPIKLFEYMALGKPIVTTDMPECRLYTSVLIGEDEDHFIEQVDVAVREKDNKDYKYILNQEALENTWEAKTAAIVKLLENKNQTDES